MIGTGTASNNAFTYSRKNSGIWHRVIFLFSLLIFLTVGIKAQQTNTKPVKSTTTNARTSKATQKKNGNTLKPSNAQHKPTTTPTKKQNTQTPPKILTATRKTAVKDTHHVIKKTIVPVKKKVVKKAIDTASILDGPQATSVHPKATAQKEEKKSSPTIITQTSSKATKDTKKQVPFVRKPDPLWEKTMAVKYLPLKSKAIYVMDERHTFESKDLLFYIVSGLFLLFGIVRSAFPKYFDSLFQNMLSFSVADRSENGTGQNNLPSLLLNLLFCISIGLLTTLILTQSTQPSTEFWKIWITISLALGVIYLVKYLTIFLSGWVFNAKEDAHVYTYVVFTINKVIGIISLPTILIFAFAQQPQWNATILTIGGILLIGLLLYRYIVTFSVITRNLQLNAFHFFLYLCSVEIIPILVLYKLFFKDLIHWI